MPLYKIFGVLLVSILIFAFILEVEPHEPNNSFKGNKRTIGFASTAKFRKIILKNKNGMYWTDSSTARFISLFEQLKLAFNAILKPDKQINSSDYFNTFKKGRFG